MKKRIDGTNRMITAFLAMTIVFLSMSMSIYAWFSLSKSLKDPIEFTTGATDVPLNMYIGRVRAAASYQEGDENYLEAGQESTRFESLCGVDAFKVGHIGMSGNGNNGDQTLTYTLADISFGSLASLGDPEPENIIYLRLEVPSANGTNLLFALSYTDDTAPGAIPYLNIYQKTDTEYTKYTGEDAIADVDAADAAHNGFLQYQYAISTKRYALSAEVPQVDENDPIPFDDTISAAQDANQLTFIGDGNEDWIDFKTYTCANAAANTTWNPYNPEMPGDVTVDTPYYIYIKIIPNTDAFADVIDTLPSDALMTFSLQLQFEITDKKTAEPTP